MRRKLSIAAGLVAVAVAVVPGIALANASHTHAVAGHPVTVTQLHVVGHMANADHGNGTQNPPPSNPPCDSDNHNNNPPGNSGKTCTSSSSGAGQDCDGDSDGSDCHGSNGGHDCDQDRDNPGNGKSDCASSSESNGGGSSSSSSSSNGGGESSVCESGGALPTGAGDGPGPNETLGDAIYDGISGSPLGNVGGLIQDPGERGFGPLSNGLNGVPAPLGTELACVVNVVYLQGGQGNLPNGL